MHRCLFCSIPGAQIVLQNDAAIAVKDGYPLSRGHLLVVPRRHVASVYDLGRSEQEAIWVLVREARHKIDKDLEPDGFNVGLNDGEAAGQTVMHAHVHVIPRWKGDVPDPRGGIRWVVPSKAKYWAE